MWKQYLQPTKSTKAKSKEPDNIRERVQSLSQALSGLKEEIKIETSANAQNLERLEKQQFGTLHSQVFALKKAFTELADAMLDEVEGVRNEYRAEFSEFKEEITEKLENSLEFSKKTQETCSKVNSSLTHSMTQAFQHISNIKFQQDSLHSNISELKSEVFIEIDSQKKFCEKIEHLLENNSKDLSKFFSEQSETRLKISEIEKIPKNVSLVIEKEKERVKLIEEKFNKEIFEISKQTRVIERNIEGLFNKKEFQDIKNYCKSVENRFEHCFEDVKRDFARFCVENENK